MKKVISVLLAVAMLAALMVPAFALDQDNPTGEAIVKTSTQTEGGEDAWNYNVSIPAETVIAWGAESTDLEGVTAEAHLYYGEKLYVSVAGNDKMVYTPEEGTTFELPYALAGDTAYESEGPVVYPAAALDLKVNVAADDWNKAVVGEYSDTLTFTAEVK